MRVADKMNYAQVKTNLASNRTKMADMQNQAATQKRVTKPSDDPVAANRILAGRIEIAGNLQFNKNLDYAKSFLSFTDSSLEELTESLVRVKELALSQANDASANELSREVVATEISQVAQQMVAIGNRKFGDRFIFGGFRTVKTPFSAKGEYRGDNGEIRIHINKDSFVTMNIPGDQVFLGKGINTDGFLNPSLDQARDIEELHIQLGSKKTSKNAEESEGAEGLEIRGPASMVQSEKELAGGRKLRLVNTTKKEKVEGGKNLFGVLERLVVSLKANDKKGVQDSLNEIDDSFSQVIVTRAQVGSRVTSLNNIQQTLHKEKIDTKEIVSRLEDADVFELMSDMNQTEGTLKATLATSGRLIQPSLLEFLR